MTSGILQSTEMSSSNQNLRFPPGSLHNAWEPPHHNASPLLSLWSPPLCQSLSPYPVLAMLCLTRLLLLNSLIITQERSIHSCWPIMHPHLSPQVSWFSRKSRERVQAQPWRDKPPPPLQLNDIQFPWRILLPRVFRELALFEGRRRRIRSAPAFPLGLHHLCLQGLSVVWVGNPKSPRNLLLNSSSNQNNPLLSAGKEICPPPLRSVKQRQFCYLTPYLMLPANHRLPLLSATLFPSRPLWCHCHRRALKTIVPMLAPKMKMRTIWVTLERTPLKQMFKIES